MNALQLIESIAEQAGVYIELYGDGDEGLAEKLHDFEVRIARQPSWPFEYHIGQIVGPETVDEDAECPEHEGYIPGHPGCDWKPEKDEDAPKVIYIAESGQIGYLPGSVKSTLGWGR